MSTSILRASFATLALVHQLARFGDHDLQVGAHQRLTTREPELSRAEFAALPIKESVRPKILLHNAAKFLDIKLQ